MPTCARPRAPAFRECVVAAFLVGVLLTYGIVLVVVVQEQPTNWVVFAVCMLLVIVTLVWLAAPKSVLSADDYLVRIGGQTAGDAKLVGGVDMTEGDARRRGIAFNLEDHLLFVADDQQNEKFQRVANAGADAQTSEYDWVFRVPGVGDERYATRRRLHVATAGPVTLSDDERAWIFMENAAVAGLALVAASAVGVVILVVDMVPLASVVAWTVVTVAFAIHLFCIISLVRSNVWPKWRIGLLGAHVVIGLSAAALIVLVVGGSVDAGTKTARALGLLVLVSVSSLVPAVVSGAHLIYKHELDVVNQLVFVAVYWFALALALTLVGVVELVPSDGRIVVIAVLLADVIIYCVALVLSVAGSGAGGTRPKTTIALYSALAGMCVTSAGVIATGAAWAVMGADAPGVVLTLLVSFGVFAATLTLAWIVQRFHISTLHVSSITISAVGIAALIVLLSLRWTVFALSSVGVQRFVNTLMIITGVLVVVSTSGYVLVLIGLCSRRGPSAARARLACCARGKPTKARTSGDEPQEALVTDRGPIGREAAAAASPVASLTLGPRPAMDMHAIRRLITRVVDAHVGQSKQS